jgi:hypothetical protein
MNLGFARTGNAAGGARLWQQAPSWDGARCLQGTRPFDAHSWRSPMRSFIGLFHAMVLSMLAASQASATSVWTSYGTITSVEVVETGDFLVTLSTGVGASCTAAGAIYMYAGQNSVTANGVKSLLAAAMSAFVAGKTVRILYDNSTPYCYGQYFTMAQ